MVYYVKSVFLFKIIVLFLIIGLFSCGKKETINSKSQSFPSISQSNKNYELLNKANAELVSLPSADEQFTLDELNKNKTLIKGFNIDQHKKNLKKLILPRKITFSDNSSSKPALICYYDSFNKQTNTHQLLWAWGINTELSHSAPKDFILNTGFYYLDEDELRFPNLAMVSQKSDKTLQDVCEKSFHYWKQERSYWNTSDLIYSSLPDNAKFAYYAEAKSSLSYSRFLFAADKKPKTIFTNLVAFGDSISDNGNLYRRTLGNIPRSDYYYKGRFTNGFNWIDNVEHTLNLPVYNSAFASAETSNVIHFNLPLSILESIADYHAQKGVWQGFHYGGYIGSAVYGDTVVSGTPDTTLFSVYAGGNNYLDYIKEQNPSSSWQSSLSPIKFKNPFISGIFMNTEDFTTQTINDLEIGIKGLMSIGGKYFILPNLPNLGLIPQGKSAGSIYSAELSKAVMLHNKKLLERIKSMAESHPDVSFIHLDIFSMVDEMMKNPALYHFAHPQEACYKGNYWYLPFETKPTVCSNPDEYIFWDTVHPTKKAHGLISYLLNNYLIKNFPN